MVTVFKLDKVITEGTSYKTHARVAYVVKKLGTDAASATHLKVDNKPLGDLIRDVAPMRKTSSYIIGPLDLGELSYVIPPDTDFVVEGASGAKMRLIGEIHLLEPGETLAGDLMGRFDRQTEHYKTYVTGSYSFGSATEWADGDEVELYTLTPSTIEKYIFNGIIMVDYTGFTPNPGDVAIQFYLDNSPIENLFSTNLAGGIDLLSMPHRDDVASNEKPFTLEDFPIEVEGDHTLKITAKNVSGGAISLNSASITLYAIVEYIKGGGA